MTDKTKEDARMDRLSTTTDASRTAATDEAEGERSTTPDQPRNEPSPWPWRFRPGICRNDHPNTSADVHGRYGEFVADCGCHEHALANARLIASAPEMLAALKAVWLLLPALERSSLESEAARFRELIEAVILKAEAPR